MMKIAGIDIGGANLKFALIRSPAPALSITPSTDLLSVPVTPEMTKPSSDIEIVGEVAFPFWTDHRQLVTKLTQLRSSWGDLDGIAITMTAELADCFENKRQGVHYIVDAVEQAFPKTACRFYTTQGKLVDAKHAKQNWALTAASNWHASAWYLFRQHQREEGFLIDIGSTTCDLIPVQAGRPVSPGQTDLDRLRNQQLVYAGVGRTAVCSLIDSVFFANDKVAIARELFATVADVMIWTHRFPARPDCCNSADQRPMTRSDCRVRLCRMLCADNEDLTDEQVTAIADQTYAALKKQIVISLQSVVDEHPLIAKTFCLAGSGQALARSAIEVVCANQPNLTIIGTPPQNETGQAIPAIAVAMKWLAAEDRR